MVQSISYDLKNPGKNYDELYKAIQSLGSYCRPLLSLWLVDCNLSQVDIYNKLKPCLDNNDLIFISSITKTNYYGYIQQTCIDWLNQHTI